MQSAKLRYFRVSTNPGFECTLAYGLNLEFLRNMGVKEPNNGYIIELDFKYFS